MPPDSINIIVAYATIQLPINGDSKSADEVLKIISGMQCIPPYILYTEITPHHTFGIHFISSISGHVIKMIPDKDGWKFCAWFNIVVQTNLELQEKILVYLRTSIPGCAAALVQ